MRRHPRCVGNQASCNATETDEYAQVIVHLDDIDICDKDMGFPKLPCQPIVGLAEKAPTDNRHHLLLHHTRPVHIIPRSY